MTLLSTLADRTGLNRFPRFKQSAKNLVYRLEDPFNRGALLPLGGCAVRVPARFARAPWSNYEIAVTRRVAGWLDAHPNAAVIDVGCSVALYSLLALARAPQGEAWAIDADLVSLQSSRWLCRYVGRERLHVIRGYAGDVPTIDLTAEAAVRATAALLTDASVPSEPSLANYVCLDTQAENEIPVHRIDRLFAQADRSRPWLMKIDVEGAEQLVLRGAGGFLQRVRPQLLVSVHPPALRGYGLTPDDIRAWLVERNYSISIDIEPHEEHWWCSPSV
jgi:FkbM family methyltransferase